MELDVLRLHNRIQLLQAEEEKALRRIEETRSKARQILMTRAENEAQKSELQAIRERELKKRQASVRRRNAATYRMPGETSQILPSSAAGPSFESLSVVKDKQIDL